MPMRTTVRTLGAIALTLCCAAPVAAQRVSLADRVARLEQQAATAGNTAGQANVELLNRMTQMQGEIQALRNQLEQLQNENAQLKQQARDQYTDLDSRLERLESAGPAPAAQAPVTPARPATSTPPRPSTGGVPAASAGDPAGEQSAYDAALSSLRKGDYVASARGFQAYLTQYPDGALAANAWYWLGESYYATQNYPIALRSFDTLLTQFPGSSKAPDAMLKKGYAQIELGDGGPGRQTLNRVINDYPGSDAARLAASRLRALSLDAR